MKRIKIILSVLLLVSIQGYSQNSASSFTKVKLGSIGKVFITQGDSNSVVINTDASKEEIHTKIKDNALYISSGVKAEYHITMKKVSELSVSGAGEIIAESPISSDDLHLDVSGSGKMTIPMKVKDLHVDVGGAAKMNLSGTATNARIDISGSAKIEAFDLEVTNCKANISGVGKCNINVTDSLTSSVSGMGSVQYKTKPKYLSENISGIGKIQDIKSIEGRRDTTRFKIGDADFLIINNDSTRVKKKEKGSRTRPIWKGLEIGFNNYFNNYGNTDVPGGYEYMELNTGKSVMVSLNLLQKDIRFGHSNLWFFTGLGITWNNYRFDDNVFINSNQGFITGGFDTTSTNNYIKSKLTVSYLTAPVMFEWYSSRKYKNAFHIGAGALLGYRIGSHTKQKYESGSNTYKPKAYDDFYLNPFRYGARVALGFRKFNIFADYYYSSLFRDKKGPVLYPADIGITLIPF